jgi:hypothetical protein
LLAVRDHEADRRTGRPQPHGSWRAVQVTVQAGWAIACGFWALAAYVHIRSDAPMLALGVAGIGCLHALGAYIRYGALRRRQQSYREALAAYDAALARAARVADDAD